MKIRLPVIIIAGVLYAFSGYAAEKMITTDDLERKYPSEAPAENEAWLRQNERLKREAECVWLKQAADQARKAMHQEDDPRPYNQRAEEYYRAHSEYLNKCAKGSSTLY